jgi:hypothetical protein
MNDLALMIQNVLERPQDRRFFMVAQKGKQSLGETAPFEISIDERVGEWLNDQLRKTKEYLIDKDVLDIETTDEASEHIVRYLPIGEIEALSNWIDRVGEEKCELANNILGTWGDVRPRVLISKCKGDQGQSVYFIKVLKEGQTLIKKKVFVFDSGTLTLQENPRLILDDRWDGIIADGMLYLLRETSLLTLFRYYEGFRAATEEHIKTLSLCGEFANLDYLRGVIAQRVSLQKRLSKAAQGSLERIDYSRLKRFIKEGKIPLTLSSDGKIECSSLAEAKVLIDVLMDNFVKSMLTDGEYKALNKAALDVSNDF